MDSKSQEICEVLQASALGISFQYSKRAEATSYNQLFMALKLRKFLRLIYDCVECVYVCIYLWGKGRSIFPKIHSNLDNILFSVPLKAQICEEKPSYIYE